MLLAEQFQIFLDQPAFLQQCTDIWLKKQDLFEVFYDNMECSMYYKFRDGSLLKYRNDPLEDIQSIEIGLQKATRIS